jgi:hypothetical protein
MLASPHNSTKFISEVRWRIQQERQDSQPGIAESSGKNEHW